MAPPAALIVPALKRHTSTVILAHGLGDSSFLPEMWRRQNKFLETKFILPNAPSIPITVNMGMRMPGWYDIPSFDAIQENEDEKGILRSQAYFHSLIAEEIAAGIPSERIVLGGFSQGGAMSLLAGLTNPSKLGGLFGLSSYLVLRGKLRELAAGSPSKDVPLFVGHGDADPVVQYAWGQASVALLKEWGWTVDFRTYRGLGHSADPREIDDLERYLRARIPDQAEGKGAEGEPSL